MKNGILAFTLIVISILIALIVGSISGRSHRESEIKQSVTGALNQALEATITAEEYSDLDKETLSDSEKTTLNEQFRQDFTRYFLQQNNTDSDVTIDFYTADCFERALDVKITAKFNYSNGKTGTIKVRKAAIVENYLVKPTSTP